MRRLTFFRTWMGRSLKLALASGLCLAMLTPALRAQTTSTIEGRVTDQQGAAITGAEVRVTSPSLAVTRQATTDGAGRYRVVGLPAGVYSLTVSKTGFGVYRLNDIEVTLNRTL